MMSGSITDMNQGEATEMTIMVLMTLKKVNIKERRDRGITSSIVYMSYRNRQQ